MNAEDVIECRVLTGFHCLPFAQYTTPHTNRRCEHEAGMTMIGASIGGRPVGLAVLSCQNDSEKGRKLGTPTDRDLIGRCSSGFWLEIYKPQAH
jgi:hypothetical protein